jgi:hypothetical protein
LNVSGFVIAGFIVTWSVILIGVGVNWGSTRMQIATINKWIEGHERYSRDQDGETARLREAVVKLSTLAEVEAKRLDSFEKALLVLMQKVGGP